ncbi:PQQ-dependent sugar dehydrogenase [Chelativorans salis]|uniref:PQQ-dependent sugar dehydrogenase n=1 Tax=Chelativorans salis TaxID=2978478 RepID=A0ABT2LV39_9HYPH|nr:PQQ-dependent sugar dehydrogenase [Chelativorans sp. EGI FJ00035]MCT7378401.1 PQQ-dependent sugar dehydrogenase [Chelativorans sp. EGI FJ00035]
MAWKALLAAGTLLLPAHVHAQQYGELHTVETNVFRPEQRELSDDLVQQLQLPDGFSVTLFARDLQGPRMLAVGEDGTVYATGPSQGEVIALDGAGSEPRTVASDLAGVHGIAIRDRRMYLATATEIMAADIGDDGSLGEMETIIDDLPGGGQHARTTIGFAPDGALHVNMGSSCNSCFELTEEKAADLRVNVEDGSRSVFAHGLRNHLGFDWHPETGQMWATDQGVDHRGDEFPGEELNLIEEGAHYGWPFCIGDREPDWMSFTEPEGAEKGEYCRNETEAPTLTFDAHASALNLVFYDAEQFPEEYHNDAFVALHGSFNRAEPAGYKVVRVVFENGEPQQVEDFLTGFLIEDGQAHFGRPAGLAIAADGALLVADDANGAIYRIAHE